MITLSGRARYVNSGGEVVWGNWSDITFTLFAAGSDVAPPILDLGLANDTGDSAADRSTSDPTIEGRIPSAVAGVTVEIDIDNDGTPDGTTTTDGLGNFSYSPSGLTEGQVSIQARTTVTAPDSAVIVSAWTTFQYVFHTDPDGSEAQNEAGAIAQASLAAAETNYNSAISGINASYNFTVGAANADHASAVATAQITHDASAQTATAAYQASLSAATDAYASATATANSNFNASVGPLADAMGEYNFDGFTWPDTLDTDSFPQPERGGPDGPVPPAETGPTFDPARDPTYNANFSAAYSAYWSAARTARQTEFQAATAADATYWNNVAAAVTQRESDRSSAQASYLAAQNDPNPTNLATENAAHDSRIQAAFNTYQGIEAAARQAYENAANDAGDDYTTATSGPNVAEQTYANAWYAYEEALADAQADYTTAVAEPYRQYVTAVEDSYRILRKKSADYYAWQRTHQAQIDHDWLTAMALADETYGLAVASAQGNYAQALADAARDRAIAIAQAQRDLDVALATARSLAFANWAAAMQTPWADYQAALADNERAYATAVADARLIYETALANAGHTKALDLATSQKTLDDALPAATRQPKVDKSLAARNFQIARANISKARAYADAAAWEQRMTSVALAEKDHVLNLKGITRTYVIAEADADRDSRVASANASDAYDQDHDYQAYSDATAQAWQDWRLASADAWKAYENAAIDYGDVLADARSLSSKNYFLASTSADTSMRYAIADAYESAEVAIATADANYYVTPCEPRKMRRRRPPRWQRRTAKMQRLRPI